MAFDRPQYAGGKVLSVIKDESDLKNMILNHCERSIHRLRVRNNKKFVQKTLEGAKSSNVLESSLVSSRFVTKH